MALGELTKQLAQQALGSQVKEALGTTPKPAAAPQPENICATMLGQVQAMQKAAKDDEELVVLCSAAGETIRVVEFFAPSWHVLVITGLDSEKNVVRVVSPAESVQLVCKIAKVHAPAKPARIGFVAPKPKPE